MSNEAAIVRVFVYGTLKPGEANYQIYCQGKTIAETPAYIRGKLYHLSLGYPAISQGNEKIAGYLLKFDDYQILQQLDRLEDYQENRSLEENEYYRQLVEVYDKSDRYLGEAWCYFMTPEKIAFHNGILVTVNNWQGNKQLK